MSEGQLLEYREVLSDFALREIDGFFKNLPVVQRARWRWVFPEPGGVVAGMLMRRGPRRGATT